MKNKYTLFLSIPFLLGGFFLLSQATRSAASPNSLIKASGDAVYYLGDDTKRYVFPNEKIYFTWYTDFSQVQTISDEELASYQLGGNIFYRPGTRLIKITSDPKVYAVGPNGELSPLPDEATAITLYGTNWSKKVDDLSDAFFSGYSLKQPLTSSQHQEGTFFQYSGQSTSYLLQKDDNGILKAFPISESLLVSLGYPLTERLIISSSFNYSTGPTITEAQDVKAAQPNQKTATITPPPPIPSPESADITFLELQRASGETTAVESDSDALLYGFTLLGDDDAESTLNEIKFRFYVDAGGDADFLLGSDTDGIDTWPISQLVRDIRLVNSSTGKTLATVNTIDSSGIITMKPNLLLTPGAMIELEILGNVMIAPLSGARISVDFHTVDDTKFSTEATTLAVTPKRNFNNAEAPGSYVKLQEFGKLFVDTEGISTTGFQPLDTETHVYRLSFTSTGEDFSVKTLSLGMTSSGNSSASVKDLVLRYTNSQGALEEEDFSTLESGHIFKFSTTDIFVENNKEAIVDVYMTSHSQEDLYSNARLQFDFATDNFFAEGLESGEFFTQGNFADSTKLKDTTSAGNIIVLREGSLSVSPAPTTPTGIINKINKGVVMNFSLTADKRDITIKKLTFRVDTNDVNVDGDDNDMLEKIANGTPGDSLALYSYDEDLDERTKFTTGALSFAIVDGTTKTVYTSPDGIQTGTGDYGLFTYDFGGSGIKVTKGSTLSYMVDFNTTHGSTEKESTLRIKLLGDDQSTAVSEAKFLWDDGSNKPATGYLIAGLDHSGAQLTIPR